MKTRLAWNILKETFSEFSANRVMRLSAALAYYAIFSIGPLLVLIIGVAGLVLGQEGVREQVQGQIQAQMGQKAAGMVETMMSAQDSGGSLLATILGSVALVLGATGIFVQLQDALNTIWGVQPKPGRSIFRLLLARALSLGMVLLIALLLLLSMVMTGVVSAFSRQIGELISLPAWSIVAFNGLVSFAIISFLFALVFKFLPDVKIPWKAVWTGGIATALLFLVGNFVLGWYLGRQATTSAFGAAGAVVVLLMYVYYSSLIVFIGAEFTKVYALRTGKEIRPSDLAVSITDEQRAKEGSPTRQQVEDAVRRQDEHGDDTHLRKAA